MKGRKRDEENEEPVCSLAYFCVYIALTINDTGGGKARRYNKVK